MTRTYRKSLFAMALAGAMLTGVSGQAADVAKPDFNKDGSVNIPKEYRNWIYVGTPLTPNALNGGEAPFPEFHNVYVEPAAFEYFKKHGKFAEGTQIVKELVLVRKSENGNDKETGAAFEVSGQGYFQGEFAGLELAYKDNTRYPKEPGGWVYFSFGHKAEPYNPTAKPFPTAECNTCHENSAATDFTFTQFYPVLRAVMKKQ